ncbi:YhgE/Pip domain-containing protein [Nocardia paucivorans]|uniref:YhgE/Pip domain-containing protein n=1 Tax=Nocardia paucivorans TaxID=114259 RepID=UPI00030AE483
MGTKEPESASGPAAETGTADSGRDHAATRRRLRIRSWLSPVAVVTLLMALLATTYLGYVVRPEDNLHDFPIALVNRDEGDKLGDRQLDIGDQITEALMTKIPADKIDLRVVGITEAQNMQRNGDIYGAIIIPSDLTKRLAILGTASVVPGEVSRPVITVQTNPRTGTYATQIMLRIADQAMEQVNAEVGRQLTETVRAQLDSTPGASAPQLSGASRLALEKPIEVVIDPYRPLPDGTGDGLSAFFYTLLLLLAGFTGAMIINIMVDSALGFTPTEYGPWYVHYPPTPLSRLRTLLMKWGTLAVAAPIVSAVFLGVTALLDMPVDRPLALFLYSTLAILAVGVTALSVLAAFGSAGMLLNLIVFVVLGLPSAGGTVPIEATPRYLSWLATFEPMHQIFLGVRAVLYFNAHGASGLERGTWMAVFGLAFGLIFGALVTAFYDRKGMTRTPNRPAPTVA